MIIRLRTGSRLHFGLMALPGERDPAAGGPHAGAESALRVWGGAGLMVDLPGIDLEAAPAPQWSAAGPLADRILDAAHSCRRSMPPACPSRTGGHEQGALRFHLHQLPPLHQGLGTGTQLALAVARVLAEYDQPEDKTAPALAQRVGRGVRSALGIHGFDLGGFLVDGGKSRRDRLAPLVARADFPEHWRIVLMLFPNDAGVHGDSEIRAFQSLQHTRIKLATDALCRLVLMGMLPALVERDLSAFGEALYEFNQRNGEVFRPVQGGVYAHRRAADIVPYLRAQGVAGVGQSSWGPALFAVVADEDHARHVTDRLGERFPFRPADLLITRAARRGASIVT